MSTRQELAEAVVSRLSGDGPHIIGIAGAVAVGKSYLAEALAQDLRAAGRRVDVVATDAFLLSNDVLAEQNLTYRKGFPESFDLEALASFLTAARSGGALRVPVYSHQTYDIVPGEVTEIASVDVLIVEGVAALQPLIAPLLDVAIYIDAAEADVRAWFVRRFLDLVANAQPGTFYSAFTGMSPEQVTSIAEATWDGINGPNLHDHIAPTRANATIVVTKSPDHTFAVHL